MSKVHQTESLVVANDFDGYEPIIKDFDLRDAIFQCRRAIHVDDPTWKGFVVAVRQVTVNGRRCYCWN